MTEKSRRAKPLRYHLRFQIIPDGRVARNARDLADLCKMHRVEEVALIIAGVEWNDGMISAEDETRWFDATRKAKAILEKGGISVSLNIWPSVLHGDYGRGFSRGRRFEPLVSPRGEISKGCASLFDPKWRRYICRLFGRFARLGFRVIWIDDDFRCGLHHPLTWGGGFEQGALDRFARKIGRKVSREEVVTNIVKPGNPHPWRRKWLENWREVQNEVARDIAGAVKRNAPHQTKIGFMSGGPVFHSREGCDFKELLESFSIDGKVAHRPFFAPYDESLGKNRCGCALLLDVLKELHPPGCEMAPEVENYPFTEWNKSDAMTWAEMAFCMFYGSDALLMDLFPNSGNSAKEEPQVWDMLDGAGPALEWISARFAKDFRTRGVGTPWRQDAQEYVRTIRGESMDELDANFTAPGNLLMQYGVAVSVGLRKVNAIFGSLMWAYSDEEILDLLSGGLLLDPLSARVLCRRGFGEQLGIVFEGWVDREDDKYAVEVVNTRKTGLRKGFYFSVNDLRRVGKIDPQCGASEWTTIITPDRKRFGAGMVAFENELGGRVVTLAAEPTGRWPRNFQRQVVVQRAIDFLARGGFDSAMVTGGPYLMPMCFDGKDRRCVVIFNGSPDAAKPVLRMRTSIGQPMRATLLPPLAKPRRALFDVAEDKGTLSITSRSEVPYLGFLVLECGA